MCAVFYHTGSSEACCICATESFMQAQHSWCKATAQHMLSRMSTDLLRAGSRLSRLLQIADESLLSHGNREQLRSEGTSRHWLVRHLCLKQGQLELVSQGHTQMTFEYLQGWRLHHLAQQPVPALSLPHSKVFPDVQREAPVFHLVAVASGPVTGHHRKEPGSVLFAPSLQVFIYVDEITPTLLFSRQSSPSTVQRVFPQALSFYPSCLPSKQARGSLLATQQPRTNFPQLVQAVVYTDRLVTSCQVHLWMLSM